MLTIKDVEHTIGMVLRDNIGNRLTEAMCIGIEKAVVFYCDRIEQDAARAIKLAEKENALD